MTVNQTNNKHYVYAYKTLQEWQKVVSELLYLVITFCDLSFNVKLGSIHNENKLTFLKLNQHLNF